EVAVAGVLHLQHRALAVERQPRQPRHAGGAHRRVRDMTQLGESHAPQYRGPGGAAVARYRDENFGCCTWRGVHYGHGSCLARRYASQLVGEERRADEPEIFRLTERRVLARYDVDLLARRGRSHGDDRLG